MKRIQHLPIYPFRLTGFHVIAQAVLCVMDIEKLMISKNRLGGDHIKRVILSDNMIENTDTC